MEMSVFKHAQASSDDTGSKGQSRLLASVTSTQPSVTRVSDGVKVEGQLTAERATMRLEFFKQNDCQAQFTCRVVLKDTQGREHVTSSRLLQQTSGDRSVEVDEGNWTPAVALNLLSLVHEMDNKLAQVGSSSEDAWRLRVQSLENRLEDKLTSIENRMEDKIASIENRLENKLDYFENRLEDKVASLGINFVDELEKFQNILGNIITNQGSTILSHLNTKIKSDATQVEMAVKEKINDTFSSVEDDLKATRDQILAKLVSIDEKLENNVNRTGRYLTSVESKLSLLADIDKNDGFCLKSLDEAMSNISNSNMDSVRHVESQLASINQNMNLRFEQLASDVEENRVNTQTTFFDVVSATQANMTAVIQAAITDTLTLKSCEKGALSVLPHPPFPYPVVRPNQQSRFDFPYLCDTLTEGGGWLVIQRRTSGSVDFYRNWDEYKKGFGSLDEDFWLGNDKIHAITTSGTYELRITLKYKGKSSFAHYSTFSLSDEKSNYILHLGAYEGTAGDSLSYHNGRPFTTRDRDNDEHEGTNCAEANLGAWWYGACHSSNLNGKWGEKPYKGPEWRKVSDSEPLSFTEMKIRLVEDS